MREKAGVEMKKEAGKMAYSKIGVEAAEEGGSEDVSSCSSLAGCAHKLCVVNTRVTVS